MVKSESNLAVVVIHVWPEQVVKQYIECITGRDFILILRNKKKLSSGLEAITGFLLYSSCQLKDVIQKSWICRFLTQLSAQCVLWFSCLPKSKSLYVTTSRRCFPTIMWILIENHYHCRLKKYSARVILRLLFFLLGNIIFLVISWVTLGWISNYSSHLIPPNPSFKSNHSIQMHH